MALSGVGLPVGRPKITAPDARSIVLSTLAPSAKRNSSSDPPVRLSMPPKTCSLACPALRDVIRQTLRRSAPRTRSRPGPPSNAPVRRPAPTIRNTSSLAPPCAVSTSVNVVPLRVPASGPVMVQVFCVSEATNSSAPGPPET